MLAADCRPEEEGRHRTVTTVAVLGTGTMGLPMARNLLRAGLHVRAWNRSPERARPLAEQGAELAGDPAAAAEGADILLTMLSDVDAVLHVAEPALGALPEDGLWLQMSTIGVAGIERCRKLAAEADRRLVDAPVLGTREPAEKGQLVILAAGEDADLERCQPAFDAVGHKTLRIGPAGSASAAKVVINSWLVGVVGVLAETISLARALGVDPERFFDAVEGGPLDLPYARLKGRAMMEGAFDDASFRLALARKDGDLVLEAAARAGLEVPIMEAATGRLRRVEEAGQGDLDLAATYLATAG